eukprot:TRINITY_DN890_c0_g1_i2.p1 TRINITY_DN890_c0_g1~~TRINITY_DN890_c0_g1_i2.p1  ORF type:complete len:265 (+),score=124.73 TRINITY_DN890_c0_g1_i2:64-858(+)
MASKVKAAAMKVSKAKAKASPKSKALGNNQTPTKNVKEDLETPEKEAKAAKAGGMLKKVLDEAAGKSVTEVMAESKQRLRRIDATIAEAAALEEAQDGQVTAAKKELEKASSEIRALEEEEKSVFEKQLNLKKAIAGAAAKTEERQKELQEAQRTLDTMEVMSKSNKKLQEATKQKKAASELALAAKEKEKEVLKATKAAIAEVSAMKGRGKGKKRTTNSSDKKTPEGKASKLPKTAPAPTEAAPPDKADTAAASVALQEHDIQ